VPQDDRRRCVGTVVFRAEQAAEERPYAEQREIRRGDHDAARQQRLSAARQRLTSVLERRQVIEV